MYTFLYDVDKLSSSSLGVVCLNLEQSKFLMDHLRVEFAKIDGGPTVYTCSSWLHVHMHQLIVYVWFIELN